MWCGKMVVEALKLIARCAPIPLFLETRERSIVDRQDGRAVKGCEGVGRNWAGRRGKGWEREISSVFCYPMGDDKNINFWATYGIRMS
jgi:hypothetical protein